MSARDLVRLYRAHGWTVRVATMRDGRLVRGVRRSSPARQEWVALDALGTGRHLAVVRATESDDYGVATLDDAGAARVSWGGVPRTGLRVARRPRT